MLYNDNNTKWENLSLEVAKLRDEVKELQKGLSVDIAKHFNSFSLFYSIGSWQKTVSVSSAISMIIKHLDLVIEPGEEKKDKLVKIERGDVIHIQKPPRLRKLRKK